MSEIKRYPEYETDLAEWKHGRAHSAPCARCHGRGDYACRDEKIMLCGATKFYDLPAGTKHFRRVTGLGVLDQIIVPIQHSHPCECYKSGGHIMKRQREWEASK